MNSIIDHQMQDIVFSDKDLAEGKMTLADVIIPQGHSLIKSHCINKQETVYRIVPDVKAREHTRAEWERLYTQNHSTKD